MDQYKQQQPQLLVPRQSHAGRNHAIIFLVVIFFALPSVNVESVSLPYGLGTVNVSVTGSLSYAVFHCGEVHLTSSNTGSVLGRYIRPINRYEWVCGGNQLS